MPLASRLIAVCILLGLIVGVVLSILYIPLAQLNHRLIVEVSEVFGGGDCVDIYESTYCFTDIEGLPALADSGEVLNVYYDGDMEGDLIQFDPPWHLGSLAESSMYCYEEGTYALVYVLDTWIDIDHPEFEGRAQRGPSFASGQHFHGTHVAGLVGSKTYGVNKYAHIVGIQVLNEQNRGSWSTLLRALSFLTTQPRGVINLSLNGDFSEVLNKVVNYMAKVGWRIVTSAGNSALDACNFSPSAARGALTVGSYRQNLYLSDFSNRGPCVDIQAPGSEIKSLYPQGRLAIAYGTSMAAPIVSGLWSLNTKLNASEFRRVHCDWKLLKEMPQGTTHCKVRK